jgi:hypothetical protein
MSYRLVTIHPSKGERHVLLDPDTRGTLVLDFAYGPIDCSTCAKGIPTLAQIIIKRDEAAGVFAVLCPFCAPDHIEARRDGAIAFVRDMERALEEEKRG